MVRRLAAALIVAGAAGVLARVPVVSAGMLRIDAATVLIFAAAAYYLLADWVYALGLLAASSILYLFGAALPLGAAFALLATGALFATAVHRVPKWLRLRQSSS